MYISVMCKHACVCVCICAWVLACFCAVKMDGQAFFTCVCVREGETDRQTEMDSERARMCVWGGYD